MKYKHDFNLKLYFSNYLEKAMLLLTLIKQFVEWKSLKKKFTF